MSVSVPDRPNQTLTERVLVSRQPIYRADMTVFGYELLFREGDTDHAVVTDGAQATAQVILNTWEIGMDAMVGRHLAFINFERNMLMGDYCDSLPADRVVLEVLETVEPEPTLIERLRQLRRKGFRIALDDFVCNERYQPLLEVADEVKIDVLATDWTEIERAVGIIRKYPVKLIAEKVETREQFMRCREAGFQLFQGYFFCRPQNVSSKAMPPNRMAMIKLLTLLNKPDTQIEELEKAISQDLALTYKLLRYINSAMCNLSRNVESIRHAIVLAGLDKMRTWASVIVFSGFEDTPRDVIVTGAIRARMCESLATKLGLPNPERYFLVGLFSVLDAVLDRPMEQILSMLSLSDDIREALLENKGQLGTVLTCVRSWERRDWENAQASVQLVQHAVESSYLEALSWSSNMIGLPASR
jgi:EAL and modified HD-GYP domain-containing signal transduction protein